MPTDPRPYLAPTLSRLRRQAGLTRNELALLADMSGQTVILIEEGRREERFRRCWIVGISTVRTRSGPLCCRTD